jgi:coenzyme F420-reducing hydrogenase delta subunit
LDFVSAAEGEGFARLVTGMVEAIKPLGPLGLVADRHGLDKPI